MQPITCHDNPQLPDIRDGMKAIIDGLLADKRFSVASCKDIASQCGQAIKTAKEEIKGLDEKIAACRESVAKQERWMAQAQGAVKRLEREAVNLEALREALEITA